MSLRACVSMADAFGAGVGSLRCVNGQRQDLYPLPYPHRL